ncbi:MAG: M23 family metallopeptidase [Vicinamibacteria bacterium]
MKALFDPRNTRGLLMSGVLVGALGSIVFIGFALRAQADTPDTSEAMAAPLAPLDPSALLGMPVEGIRRTDLVDGYWSRRGRRLHNALDIMAPRNTPVRAATSGTIAALNSSPAGGTSIWQYDDSGAFCYFYAHLARYAPGLRAGQPVARGAILGFVGTTGNAPKSAPHLHFAVFRLETPGRWWSGEPVNPYPLLRGDPLDGANLATE